MNRLFKISKYIIMYHEYKRREELYDLKNKLIVSKDGSISYSCVEDIDEQIEILNKAIKDRETTRSLHEKYFS